MKIYTKNYKKFPYQKKKIMFNYKNILLYIFFTFSSIQVLSMEKKISLMESQQNHISLTLSEKNNEYIISCFTQLYGMFAVPNEFFFEYHQLDINIIKILILMYNNVPKEALLKDHLIVQLNPKEDLKILEFKDQNLKNYCNFKNIKIYITKNNNKESPNIETISLSNFFENFCFLFRNNNKDLLSLLFINKTRKYFAIYYIINIFDKKYYFTLEFNNKIQKIKIENYENDNQQVLTKKKGNKFLLEGKIIKMDYKLLQLINVFYQDMLVHLTLKFPIKENILSFYHVNILNKNCFEMKTLYNETIKFLKNRIKDKNTTISQADMTRYTEYTKLFQLCYYEKFFILNENKQINQLKLPYSFKIENYPHKDILCYIIILFNTIYTERKNIINYFHISNNEFFHLFINKIIKTVENQWYFLNDQFKNYTIKISKENPQDNQSIKVFYTLDEKYKIYTYVFTIFFENFDKELPFSLQIPISPLLQLKIVIVNENHYKINFFNYYDQNLLSIYKPENEDIVIESQIYDCPITYIARDVIDISYELINKIINFYNDIQIYFLSNETYIQSIETIKTSFNPIILQICKEILEKDYILIEQKQKILIEQKQKKILQICKEILEKHYILITEKQKKIYSSEILINDDLLQKIPINLSQPISLLMSQNTSLNKQIFDLIEQINNYIESFVATDNIENINIKDKIEMFISFEKEIEIKLNEKNTLNNLIQTSIQETIDKILKIISINSNNLNNLNKIKKLLLMELYCDINLYSNDENTQTNYRNIFNIKINEINKLQQEIKTLEPSIKLLNEALFANKNDILKFFEQLNNEKYLSILNMNYDIIIKVEKILEKFQNIEYELNKKIKPLIDEINNQISTLINENLHQETEVIKIGDDEKKENLLKDITINKDKLQDLENIIKTIYNNIYEIKNLQEISNINKELKDIRTKQKIIKEQLN